MDYEENEDKDIKRVYKTPLNYENGIILPLIRDCCVSRANDEKMYSINVKTLSMVLPKELRKMSNDFYNGDITVQDLSNEGKIKLDKLFVYNLEILEQHNICFPKLSFKQGAL